MNTYTTETFQKLNKRRPLFSSDNDDSVTIKRAHKTKPSYRLERSAKRGWGEE